MVGSHLFHRVNSQGTNDKTPNSSGIFRGHLLPRLGELTVCISGMHILEVSLVLSRGSPPGPWNAVISVWCGIQSSRINDGLFLLLCGRVQTSAKVPQGNNSQILGACVWIWRQMSIYIFINTHTCSHRACRLFLENPTPFFLYIFLNLFILYCNYFLSNISHFQGNSKVQIQSFFKHTACNNVFYVSPINSLTFYYVIPFSINSW